MGNDQLLTLFITLLTVIDPPGIIPIYLPVANQFEKEVHTKIILFSCLVALGVSTCFLFGGKLLFESLGIQTYSIYAAGGILLFLIGLDMIHAQPKKTKTSPQDQHEPRENYRDVCVFPLAIPMLCGPGTIATLIMSVSQNNSHASYFSVFIMLVIIYSLCALTMYFSGAFLKVLGRTGLNVIDRMMGIILCALAIQFIANSLLMFMKTLPS